VGLVNGWDVRGRENIPAEGALIVASNHVSFWDPPLVGAAANRELHYLAKEELFRTPLVGPLVRGFNAIPIRRGVADLRGLSMALEVLKRGQALLLFPEGSRMRDGRLHPARPGVGMLAVSANAPIVPCHVHGSSRPRRWLLRQERLHIAFGPVRPWQEFAGPGDSEPGRALYQRVGEGVMRAIADLREEHRVMASRGAA
jgi:1-acyl-sn-glycerol-3-phosphate acyltransferase